MTALEYLGEVPKRTPCRVLGIDPARSCGWSVNEGKRRVASGTWTFPLKHDADGTNSLQFVRALEWVIQHYRPDGIAFEVFAHQKSKAAARLAGGWYALIRYVAQLHRIPLWAVEPGFVKEVATADSYAAKSSMIAAAAAKWGYTPSTDDEADAMWIAETALRYWGKSRARKETRTRGPRRKVRRT